MCNLGKLYYATTEELSHLHEAIAGLYLNIRRLNITGHCDPQGESATPLQLLGTMPLLGSSATPMKQLLVTDLVQPHQTYYH